MQDSMTWKCVHQSLTETFTPPVMSLRKVLDLGICNIFQLTCLLHLEQSVSAGRLQKVILGDVTILAAVTLESVGTPRARAEKPRVCSVRLLAESIF